VAVVVVVIHNQAFKITMAVLVVQALSSLDTWRKGKIQWHILQR
jgi:hypothetical protein